ncbi:glycosyltransferase [Halovenus marina]|uniref:glycosyltransferase n=1 Tax=Halovenus marina TaxID=3396621 RepID=UPI003F57E7AF
MNILEALQKSYNVILLTTTTPDFTELNKFFGTSVSDVKIKKPTDAAMRSAKWASSSLPINIGLAAFQYSLLYRHARNVQNAYDLVISTRDEIGFNTKALQYIHIPTRGLIKKGGREAIPGYRGNTSALYEVYDHMCNIISGFSTERVRQSRLLTNSDWTANLIEEIYNTETEVVYPPIEVDEFSNPAWEQRESGFVMIGRLSPEKRILRSIKVIERLHEYNNDIHIHVIGPKEDTEYSDQVEQYAAERDYVYLDGECNRKDLIERIQQHKYGIHGKEFEHFGMVVAEMIAGGTIPFVHNSGGQTDIVLNDDRLIYDDVEEAVQKAKKVIGDSSLQQELAKMLTESVHRFSKQTFQQQIRNIVSEEINPDKNA